jgi:GH24 family phage-related lysozyme (muramidase)
MPTVSGLLAQNSFSHESLQGITDPQEYDRAYHRAIRENLQAGGLLPPTEGITTPVTDANDTGSFFKDTVNKITGYAGVKAFDTTGDRYEDRRFKFIAAEEGYRDGVYMDSLKRRTIGYGFNLDEPTNRNLAKSVLKLDDAKFEAIRSGKQNITQHQARQLFEASVSGAEKIVDARLGSTPLNSHQRLALVSLAYNHPNLIGPKITAAIKNGDAEAALHEIRNNSNKYNIKGIQSRRNREAQLFAGYAKDESQINLAGQFGLISSANAAETPRNPRINADTPGVVEGWAKHFAENPPKPEPDPNALTLGGQEIKRADGSSVIGDTGYFGSHVHMLIKDVFNSQVNRFAGQDIMDWNKMTYDASFFRKNELEAMLTTIGRSYVRGGGKSSGAVHYTDPNKKGKNDYKTGMKDVSWSSSGVNLTGDDAEHVVKTTLGQFRWHLNKQGELIVEDQYNFNDAEKLRKQYDNDFKRAMHLTALVGMASTGVGDIGWYGVIRRFAAFYGSKEGEGASFKINLGKVDMRRLASETRKGDKELATQARKKKQRNS